MSHSRQQVAGHNRMSNQATEFQIWMSGWQATGDGASAQLLGKESGETFEEACDRFFARPENSDYAKDYEKKGLFMGEGGKLERRKCLSVWGCSLHDNETDARRSFG